MPKSVLSLFCSLLLVALPSDAASVIGSVQPTGSVLVNSRGVSHQSAVFSGDVIETAGKASAVITWRALVAKVGENSRVQIQPTEFQLASGVMVLDTQPQTAAHV